MTYKDADSSPYVEFTSPTALFRPEDVHEIGQLGLAPRTDLIPHGTRIVSVNSLTSVTLKRMGRFEAVWFRTRSRVRSICRRARGALVDLWWYVTDPEDAIEIDWSTFAHTLDDDRPWRVRRQGDSFYEYRRDAW